MTTELPPRYINERINPAYVDSLEKTISHIKSALATLDSMLNNDDSLDRLAMYGATLKNIKRIIS